jgi:hypothetical protein
MNERWTAHPAPIRPKNGHQQHPGPEQDPGQQNTGHGGHQWMMMACCLPMLVIAVVLVATGVAGAGTIFGAVLCTVMMALMMRGMGHGEGGRR